MTDITDSVNSNYSLLEKTYGENKEIPVEYQKQIIYALSYFPELIHTKIEFKVEKSTSGIISTRPVISSLMKKSSRRTYLVIINDSTGGGSMPAFSGCDINGQVGILGHELCHILFFNNQTGLGLLGLGVAHVSSSYIDHFENKTDSMDIEKGLGYQLIDWNECLHQRFKTMHPDNSKPSGHSSGRERYMSIEHIRRVMANSKAYQKKPIQ
jgi:hypothetical protein